MKRLSIIVPVYNSEAYLEECLTSLVLQDVLDFEVIIVDSNSSDNELLAIFKENISNQNELDYFIITEIDKLNADIQNKYYQIVKDREFFGVELPEDMVIVLTVKDKEGLKNISRELYNLCVVAF